MLAVSASSAFPAPDHFQPSRITTPAAAPVRPDGGSGRWRDLHIPAQPWRHRPVSAFCPGNNRRVADLLQAVKRPIEADKDLPARVSIAPAAVSTFWLFSAAKSPPGETQSGETVMRKREINALRLFAEDIHFSPRIHAAAAGAGLRRHAPAAAAALPAPSGQRGKGDIGEFVIHHRAGDAGRQVFRLIPELLRA